MKEEIRPLTAYEVTAMWLFHDRYAALGIGAIEFYKNLSASDRGLVQDMVRQILKAAKK